MPRTRKKKKYTLWTYAAIHHWRGTAATNGPFRSFSVARCCGVVVRRHIDAVHSLSRIRIAYCCGVCCWSRIYTLYLKNTSLSSGHVSIPACCGMGELTLSYSDAIYGLCRIIITLSCSISSWSHVDTVYMKELPLGSVHVSITDCFWVVAPTWSNINVVGITVVATITVCCGVHFGILCHLQRPLCSCCPLLCWLRCQSHSTPPISPSPHIGTMAGSVPMGSCKNVFFCLDYCRIIFEGKTKVEDLMERKLDIT